MPHHPLKVEGEQVMELGGRQHALLNTGIAIGVGVVDAQVGSTQGGHVHV